MVITLILLSIPLIAAAMVLLEDKRIQSEKRAQS